MPQDHQITCIIPDGADTDRCIDSIGGATGSKSGGPWCITRWRVGQCYLTSMCRTRL